MGISCIWLSSPKLLSQVHTFLLILIVLKNQLYLAVLTKASITGSRASPVCPAASSPTCTPSSPTTTTTISSPPSQGSGWPRLPQLSSTWNPQKSRPFGERLLGLSVGRQVARCSWFHLPCTRRSSSSSSSSPSCICTARSAPALSCSFSWTGHARTCCCQYKLSCYKRSYFTKKFTFLLVQPFILLGSL